MSRWHLIDNTLEGRQRIYFPHWAKNKFPTEPEANMAFRRRLWKTSNRAEREYIKKLCAEDFLFYLYGFVNIFQAKSDPKPVPFLPYEFQIDVFTILWKCLHDGQEDVRMKKPRDVGATWMVMSIFEHSWHFRKYLQFLVGSRREDEIDGVSKNASGATPAGEWSKLLPKVDFIHLHQPSWIWPKGYRPRQEPYRTRLRIANPELGGLITGESANPKFGRSQRFYAIGFDEHAHTEYGFDIIGACSQTSDCHIWWSSPSGPATAFAMLGRSPIRQINLDWWMHPLHSEGLTLDEQTGKRWSPWYEKECSRVGWNQKLINDEIHADETQAGGGYYDAKVFEIIEGGPARAGTVMDPIRRGEFDITMGQDGPWVTRWCDQVNGRWLLWLNFDKNGRPPRGTRYIVAVDVAAGTQDSDGRGASNSVIAIFDWKTGELVAEFATHGMAPYELADVIVAVGRWFEGEDFGPAFVIYERNGPGAELANPLDKKWRYPQLWREKRAWAHDKQEKVGWYKDGTETGRKAFALHPLMIVEGRLIERSRACAEEMRFYNHPSTGNGPPVHASSTQTDDPTGARANHGDRVITRVLACQVIDKWKHEVVSEAPEPVRGSREWFDRRNEHLRWESMRV